MLNPETASKELEKFKSPDFLGQRLDRLAGLPAELQPDVRVIFELDKPKRPNPPHDWLAYSQRQQKIRETFRAMSPEMLEQLIRAMTPELAPYILRAIENLRHLPYTSGYARKPFRSPSRRHLFNTVRADLVLSVLTIFREYPPDIEWLAVWAPHAWPRDYKSIGQLLAAAIDLGDEKGQRVYDILLASAKGEHEIGQMGGHVIAALLMAGKQEGWQFVQQMLLAAQREEGLRQTILEMIDEGRPEVFPRFLRLILEHDLTRFSATVRAVDVWFGFAWDAMSAGKARQLIELTWRFFEDPAAGDAAITKASTLPAVSENPKGKKLVEADEAVEPAYIALWTKAFADVFTSFTPAQGMLKSANVDARFVATHLLGQLGLTGGPAKAIAAMLADGDQRVAARAVAHFVSGAHVPVKRLTHGVEDLFERLEKVMPAAPDKTVKLAPALWPWMRLSWGKEMLGAALISALGDRAPTRMLPYMGHLSKFSRLALIHLFGKSEKWDAPTRDALFGFVADPAAVVRQAAIELLKKCTIDDSEAQRLEGLLTRKASDLRRAILVLLLSQKDDAALASADRLMQSKDEWQRLAGLEIVRKLAAENPRAGDCRARAQTYRQSNPRLTVDEETHLTALSTPSHDQVTLDNCLGLINPAKRTPPPAPTKRNVRFVSLAAVGLLQGLDVLAHQHREVPFTPRTPNGVEHEPILFGNARPWELPHPAADQTLDQLSAMMPMRDQFLPWFDNRPASLRDDDGLEVPRAQWLFHNSMFKKAPGGPTNGLESMNSWLFGESPGEVRYSNVVGVLLQWFAALYPSPNRWAFFLDGLETILASIPKDKLTEVIKHSPFHEGDVVWRGGRSPLGYWLGHAPASNEFQATQDAIRHYRLARWIDEPGVPIPRFRPGTEIVLRAYAAGGATDADIFDQLIGSGNRYSAHYYRRSAGIDSYSSLKPHPDLLKYPFLKSVVDKSRQRVLEIEVARGETPTCVSPIALSLRHTGGLEVLVPFLRAAEKNTFTRGHAYNNESKAVVFSRVIRATYPADQDSAEQFSAAVKGAAIPDERLLELAVYAPQWSSHVEHALAWPHVAEAVWWIHAHTRDRGWSVDQELREKWRAQVALRTALDAEDLLDGAVDVAWFHRTHENLGKKRWDAIYKVAKYAASGGGHRRAQLFADAMLGKEPAHSIMDHIGAKRNQDYVRALGLVPFAGGDHAKSEVLERYRTLQEFIRTSRQFGSMRQASEKRAASIGMENLARTAAYPDPVRLQWAMEAQACADLAQGPVTLESHGVTLNLVISSEGEPELGCSRNGKKLSAIPAAVRKGPEVAELADRKTDLRRSRSRMRTSLEQAMVRGDVFFGRDLRELAANPLLYPMLERLVFVNEAIRGYPVDSGRGLIDCAGKIEPVKLGENLRLAHPLDLLATGHWTKWQRDCFARERIQPFKQVFRELYIQTKTEADAKVASRRYAGHQVQPRQAMALLGTRGWIASPEIGVFRPFHDLGFTAWLTFLQPFLTPAEIEGLTLEEVYFTKRADLPESVPLIQVPPRAFSEVMRDLDLVVSVAHRGGVDPEASASTIQMRTALISETLELLNIQNVRIQETHALIQGKLAEYSLHLGSAVTHRLPGGALFIVPVHSQHRGRLFLPFADDDPKTAEVISKILLLARDHQIKDPHLLSQIRSL